jgi:hypothetical protein
MNPSAISGALARSRSAPSSKGKTAWTKRNKKGGQFMAVKKGKKKFKGVRRENPAKKRARKKR